MTVASGATIKKYEYKVNVNGTNLFFTTYVDYTVGANGSASANTTLLYISPIDANTPSDALLTNSGGYYKAAAVLENGKWKPLTENNSTYVTSAGTLSATAPSNSGTGYVLSNEARASLASNNPTSLGSVAKKNATTILDDQPDVSTSVAQAAITGNSTAAPSQTAQTEGGPGASSVTPPLPSSTDSENPNENTTPINLSDLNVANQNEQYYSTIDFTQGKSFLEYPLKASSSDQDVLKIEILRYNASEIDLSDLSLNRRAFGNNKDSKGKNQSSGTIYLGLQASISDQNTVGWGQDSMSAIDMFAQNAFLNLISNGAPAVSSIEEAFQNRFNKTKGVQEGSVTALKTLGAKLASNTGSGNLFTRITGAIVNPNMELLFNGPQLRPFTFTFNMSPRGKDEAESVKAIIKALKQSSAVQIGVGNLFLKTPFVYKLTYCTERLKPHQSLNRIKECALTNISIDYTPANVYMTYNDTEKTMTSYSMQLQFMELDPIYGDDYKGNDVGKIGY